MARRRSSYSQPGGHWSPPSLYELYHPAGFVQKADYGLYQFKTVFLPRYRDSTTRGAHSAPGFFSTEDAPPQIVCEQIELTAEKTFDFDISELPSLLKYTEANPFKFEVAPHFSAPEPILKLPDPPSKFRTDQARVRLEALPREPIFAPPPPPTNALLAALDPWAKERAKKREDAARLKFSEVHARWKKECEQVEARNARTIAETNEHKEYLAALGKFEDRVRSLKFELQSAQRQWQEEKRKYDDARSSETQALKALADRLDRHDDMSLAQYVQIAISTVVYPYKVPRIYEVRCNLEKGIIYVEVLVPAFGNTNFFALSQKRNGTVERKSSSARERKSSYDFLLYSLIVRTVFDIAIQDLVSDFDMIALNARTEFKDPATGLDKAAIVASVVVPLSAARAIDLVHIEPQETFRAWKGISARSLSDAVPVQPIIWFNKADERFVEGRDILQTTDNRQNLAEMEWTDFEHLVRQLFEKEFKQHGAEVKVTRSSRDRGVDAIIFDPDPLRGGKIVIQAKRYTNNVDVAAVRELYGTVQNENANKGILVTTSHYGPDAYEFAKGKNLTLLDGQNLLALLQKHGYDFRINLAEAKKKLRDQEQPPDRRAGDTPPERGPA